MRSARIASTLEGRLINTPQGRLVCLLPLHTSRKALTALRSVEETLRAIIARTSELPGLGVNITTTTNSCRAERPPCKSSLHF